MVSSRAKSHLKAKACSHLTGLSLAAPCSLPNPTDKEDKDLPPGFSGFVPKPQTLTFFFWQGSHWLHEDHADSVQSRGCGRSLTDRACLLLAMLSLVPLRLRDSFSPLHSMTRELQGVKSLSCEHRATWPTHRQNYSPKRTNAC